MHERAGVLLPEILRGRSRDKECSVEVRVDHSAPFSLAHLEKHPITQNTGIVHDGIDAAEVPDGIVNDRFRAPCVGDAGDIRKPFAAFALYLANNLDGGALVASFSGGRAAKIVDNDRGALAGA